MLDTNRKERKIVVDATKCQCCWICVMRCGLRFDKTINPRAAKIRVSPYYGCWPDIQLTEECDACGICVRHCPTGALAFETKSAA